MYQGKLFFFCRPGSTIVVRLPHYCKLLSGVLRCCAEADEREFFVHFDGKLMIEMNAMVIVRNRTILSTCEQ